MTMCSGMLSMFLLACGAYYLTHHPSASIEAIVSVQVAAAADPPAGSRLPPAQQPSARAARPPPSPPMPVPRPDPLPHRIDAASAWTSTTRHRRFFEAISALEDRRREAGLHGSRPCVELSAWDSSHFSADQDWCPLANGRRAAPDTLWRWVEARGAGHLMNQMSMGHLNGRPGGFVRGHGNAERPPRRPARQSETTALVREEAKHGRFASADGRACSWAGSYYTFRFRKHGGYLHVEEDGTLAAHKETCSDDPACLFTLEEAGPGHGGWSLMRSVLTGGLVRMVGDGHPRFDGWGGVGAPKAVPKGDARLKEQRLAAAAALSGRGGGACPLRRAAAAGAPEGWRYNASLYASQVRRALAPWYDGGVTATAVDVAFFSQMYPYTNRNERPTLHVSVRPDGIRTRWQPPPATALPAQPTAPPRPVGAAPSSEAGGGGPPAGSAEASFVRMLREVAERVELPAVEFVAHTSRLPKVPAQNLELVFAPAADDAHNDVVAPSAWLYDSVRGAPPLGPGGARGGSARAGGGPPGASGAPPTRCPPPSRRRAQLLLQAECNGSPQGFHGPLWRHYPQHRAALLAARHPSLAGVLVVALRQPCVGPPLEGLPLEPAWEAQAAADLLTEAGAVLHAGGAPEAAEPCAYRWELLMDDEGPPRHLVAALARGATVFRVASPYREFYSGLLQPWVHYVPVADNLHDLAERVAWAQAHPGRAEAIGAAGARVAARLHAYEISCFWWQLLSALAPLQDFEARADGAGP